MESQRGGDGTFHSDVEYVTAGFARQLGEELTRATAERQALLSIVQRLAAFRDPHRCTIFDLQGVISDAHELMAQIK